MSCHEIHPEIVLNFYKFPTSIFFKSFEFWNNGLSAEVNMTKAKSGHVHPYFENFKVYVSSFLV